MGISVDDKIVCYTNNKNRELFKQYFLPDFSLLVDFLPLSDFTEKSVGMIRRLVDAIAAADEIY